jgi:KDO2-lipid IV(A) lauroyltransferase
VRDWVNRAFVSYARYWFEGARLPSTPPSVVAQRMMADGMEHLAAGMRAGKGVIMALPHIGSWEWGGYWLAVKGYPMVSVAEPVEPPELYDWFVREREAMGLTILPLDDAAPALLRALRAGRLVGLLCEPRCRRGLPCWPCAPGRRCCPLRSTRCRARNTGG